MDNLKFKVDSNWLKGIYVDGEYKSFKEDQTELLGDCSLSEAISMGLISPGDHLPHYCEDTGEFIGHIQF